MPTPHRQHGFTLISLMTGLAISMVIVLATLMLFQRMVRSTTTARSDAQADAQRSAAFLAAGIALQEAGFGIDLPQAGTHLVVLSNATLDGATLSGSAGDTGNAVVWAENTTGTPRCSALLSPPSGGLRKLGPVSCADAAAWASLAWTASVLSDAPAAPATVALQPTPCRPFGVTADEGHLLVSLRAANSNGVELSTSQCLANFPS